MSKITQVVLQYLTIKLLLEDVIRVSKVVIPMSGGNDNYWCICEYPGLALCYDQISVASDLIQKIFYENIINPK